MDQTISSCSEAEPYALRVLGDSMEPEFAEGCIIIIDPEGVARDGAFVLAAHADDELIFRQLRIDGQTCTLVALNAKYPELPLPNGLRDVRGVIIQRAGTRRKDRKFY